MKHKLDTAANVAVIIVAVVVCFVFIRSYFSTPAHSPGEVRVGDQLQTGPIDWGRYDSTLVLAIREGCEFCERSIPFYKKMAMMEKMGEINAHIIAALPDSPAAAETFLKSEGLSVEAVPGVPLGSVLRVYATPTVLLVDRNGRVMKAWIGTLTSSGERNLISTIEKKGVVGSKRKSGLPGES